MCTFIHICVKWLIFCDAMQFLGLLLIPNDIQDVVIGDGVSLPDPSEKFEELLMR